MRAMAAHAMTNKMTNNGTGQARYLARGPSAIRESAGYKDSHQGKRFQWPTTQL
jgi:hypothetical protein